DVYASALYSFIPGSETSLNDLTVTPSSATATPTVSVLPSSGHWSDVVTSQSASSTVRVISVFFGATSQVPYYVIYTGGSTDVTSPCGILVTSTAASSVQPSLNDDTPAHATVVSSLPALVSGGNLLGPSSIDYYAIQVTESGQSLHTLVYGSDPLGDVAVDIV